MTTDLITTLKICAVALVPVGLVIIKLLPKFLQGSRFEKLLIGALTLSVYLAVFVGMLASSNLPIQNIWLVVLLNAFVWGGFGFLVGMYFDVRSRGEMGNKYNQEFWLLRLHGAEYGVIGTIASLPLGLLAGWLVVTFGTSSLGLLLSFSAGLIIGGILGWGLDRYTINFFSK